MAYCTVDDVASAVAQFFQRNQTGSISDAQIQGWIDDRKARIRSAWLTRNIDTDGGALSTDQANFLRALNRDGAIADLGDALQATVTLAPGEIGIAASHRATFERVLIEIQKGLHDVLFSAKAKHTDVRPLFGGIAGAETDVNDTPATRDENRSFGKNQNF